MYNTKYCCINPSQFFIIFHRITGAKPWYNIITLLNDKNCADMEMLTQAMALVNQTLKGLPDQDSYYDVVDSLEDQGLERIIQHYLSKQGIETKLREQFVNYEAVLRYEDGDSTSDSVPESVKRLIPRAPARPNHLPNGTSDQPTSPPSGRRKSLRHSTGCVPSKVTKIVSEIVPSWQRKVLERTKQFNKSNNNGLTNVQSNARITNSSNTINGNGPRSKETAKYIDHQEVSLQD